MPPTLLTDRKQLAVPTDRLVIDYGGRSVSRPAADPERHAAADKCAGPGIHYPIVSLALELKFSNPVRAA
jgi:hypothetical protein